MRVILLGLITLVWLYSVYCVLRMAAHRSGGWRGHWLPTWSTTGLDEIGLRYRRRHVVATALGALLAGAWYLAFER